MTGKADVTISLEGQSGKNSKLRIHCKGAKNGDITQITKKPRVALSVYPDNVKAEDT